MWRRSQICYFRMGQIKQTKKMTLNFLRLLRWNPKLSAHAVLFIKFDFKVAHVALSIKKVESHTHPPTKLMLMCINHCFYSMLIKNSEHLRSRWKLVPNAIKREFQM